MSATLNDTSNFKVDDEEIKNDISKKPPPIIGRMLPPNPERKALNEKQLGEAKYKLWKDKFLDLKFPRERKLRVDPPLDGQSIGVLSFIPAPEATPDKDGCYGVVKLRGNFSNRIDAENYAKMLLRKYDTFYEYDFVRVGQDYPLMIDNSIYTESTCEVNLQAAIDDISLSYIKKKKQEERQQRIEVEERSRRLLNKNTSELKEETITDLDYYTQLRVKKAHCMNVLAQCEKQYAEAKEAIVEHDKEIVALDEQFPTYKTEYITQYEKSLDSVGAKAADNPLIKYLKQDTIESDCKYPSLAEKLESKQ